MRSWQGVFNIVGRRGVNWKEKTKQNKLTLGNDRRRRIKWKVGVVNILLVWMVWF